MKKQLIKFLKSNALKTFGWTTLNGVIVLVVMFLGDVDWRFAPLAIAGLNMMTKEINKKYL